MLMRLFILRDAEMYLVMWCVFDRDAETSSA
jgi:hypothetical protein